MRAGPAGLTLRVWGSHGFWIRMAHTCCQVTPTTARQSISRGLKLCAVLWHLQSTANGQTLRSLAPISIDSRRHQCQPRRTDPRPLTRLSHQRRWRRPGTRRGHHPRRRRQAAGDNAGPACRSGRSAGRDGCRAAQRRRQPRAVREPQSRVIVASRFNPRPSPRNDIWDSLASDFMD